MDTPCEGKLEEILKESQIAYTKAVSPSGERYLIMHPESSNFCWVNKDDVWIDGEEGSLPQVTDKRKEEQYLPFCTLLQTPVMENPDCLTSPEINDGELKYDLSHALIEKGRIPTLIINPNAAVGIEHETYEPRIANREALPNHESMKLAEGNLRVTINDREVNCSFDSMLPGRVICDDLDLDSADPQEMVLCWLGEYESQICPPGHCYIMDDNGCYLIGDSESCSYLCSPGYVYSEEFQVCLIDRDPATLGTSPELCPEGYKVNAEADCCLTPTLDEHYSCPDGFVYVAKRGACQRMVEGPECPDGLRFDQETGICLLAEEKPPSICAVIEIEFSSPVVTVKSASSCRRGPGKEYENVSSLAPFSEAEVLGIAEGEEFLIINNPKYQIPCWAPLDDFYSDKLNTEILPVITLSPEEE
jgi:hypothetical protein